MKVKSVRYYFSLSDWQKLKRLSILSKEMRKNTLNGDSVNFLDATFLMPIHIFKICMSFDPTTIQLESCPAEIPVCLPSSTYIIEHCAKMLIAACGGLD